MELSNKVGYFIAGIMTVNLLSGPNNAAIQICLTLVVNVSRHYKS